MSRKGREQRRLKHLQELKAWVEGRRCEAVCYWCGLPFEADYSPLNRTREHRIPRAFGGKDVPYNIVWAHRWCNSRRGTDAKWLPFSAHGMQGQIVRDDGSERQVIEVFGR